MIRLFTICIVWLAASVVWAQPGMWMPNGASNIKPIGTKGVSFHDSNGSHLYTWAFDDATGNYTITWNFSDGAKTITVTGNPTLDDWFDQAVKAASSPQFAGVELGHASDTTLSRTGAGAIAVEGTAVLLSGGALGTPASGDLSNCTGFPVDGAGTADQLAKWSDADTLTDAGLKESGNYFYSTIPGTSIYLGNEAGNAESGTTDYNVYIGFRAAKTATDTTRNVCIGAYAGYGLTTGDYNTIVGEAAGAGNGITTGSYNTVIGYGVTGLSSSLANTAIIASGNGVKRFYADGSGNIGLSGQTTFGTSAAKVVGIPSGTAPSSSLADMAQLWVEDIDGAGTAGFRYRTEDGKVGYVGTRGSNNQILTDDGAGGIVSESSVQIDNSSLILEKCYHTGDTDTYFQYGNDTCNFYAGGVLMLTTKEFNPDYVCVNQGSADVDFRVESDAREYALFTEGSTSNVIIGASAAGTNAVGVVGIASGTAPTSSPADMAQLWVEDVGGAGQAELRVRDELGNVTTLSPHDTDGPPAIYTQTPGIEPVVGYENAFRGTIMWVNLAGLASPITETFDEYKARRAGKFQRTLTQLTWEESEHNKAVALYLGEEIEVSEAEAVEEKAIAETQEVEEEVALPEAIESVEIMETVQDGTRKEYQVQTDEEGNIKSVQVDVPNMVERGTGKHRKRIKPGVRHDSETGKFFRTVKKQVAVVKPVLKEGYRKEEDKYYRLRTQEEAEAAVKPEDILPRPEWLPPIIAPVR